MIVCQQELDGSTDADGAQPHRDEHVDIAIAKILSSDSPSSDDILLRSMRKPQIDFDDSRAEQRTRIEAFLKEHKRSESGSP